MKSYPVAILVVICAYCYLRALAFYQHKNDGFDVAAPQYREANRKDGDNNTDLRKSFLKKLRLITVVKEHDMQSPIDAILATSDEAVDSDGTIIEPIDETDEKQPRHIAEKREQTEDLMSLVQAYLSQVKERQSKESLSLPSLRFGRSSTH